jgi:hypothetical protein
VGDLLKGSSSAQISMMHHVTDKEVGTEKSWDMGQMNDPTF